MLVVPSAHHARHQRHAVARVPEHRRRAIQIHVAGHHVVTHRLPRATRIGRQRFFQQHCRVTWVAWLLAVPPRQLAQPRQHLHLALVRVHQLVAQRAVWQHHGAPGDATVDFQHTHHAGHAAATPATAIAVHFAAQISPPTGSLRAPHTNDRAHFVDQWRPRALKKPS